MADRSNPVRSPPIARYPGLVLRTGTFSRDKRFVSEPVAEALQGHEPMDEPLEAPEMSVAEIEGRLSAQRRVLQWLLVHAAKDEAVDDLLDCLNESWPPADSQEDPGAVPANGFAVFTAAVEETRLLLEPLKQSRKSAEDMRSTGSAMQQDQ